MADPRRLINGGLGFGFGQRRHRHNRGTLQDSINSISTSSVKRAVLQTGSHRMQKAVVEDVREHHICKWLCCKMRENIIYSVGQEVYEESDPFGRLCKT
jgi:NAD(P)H-flavin reductase